MRAPGEGEVVVRRSYHIQFGSQTEEDYVLIRGYQQVRCEM